MGGWLGGSVHLGSSGTWLAFAFMVTCSRWSPLCVGGLFPGVSSGVPPSDVGPSLCLHLRGPSSTISSATASGATLCHSVCPAQGSPILGCWSLRGRVPESRGWGAGSVTPSLAYSSVSSGKGAGAYPPAVCPGTGCFLVPGGPAPALPQQPALFCAPWVLPTVAAAGHPVGTGRRAPEGAPTPLASHTPPLPTPVLQCLVRNGSWILPSAVVSRVRLSHVSLEAVCFWGLG